MIKKRDGQIVEFDITKITSAIEKAGAATGEFNITEAKKLTTEVLQNRQKLKNPPEVEEIQDIVEQVLLNSEFKKTAKAYILYREQHNQIRRITTKANVDRVDSYLDNLDWKIKENSNMCYSLQGLNNYIASGVTSEYWLNKIYPHEIRDNHKNGDFHIHDLSLLAVYCVGWDFMDFLKQGFKGVAGKIESSPPKHLASALGQLVNLFYTLQGESAGAQAVSNFNTLLAPFVRSDNLDYPQVKQLIQEFVFNVNIPTRVGFQTPFSNLTLDFSVPSFLKDHPVIIAGKEQETTYSDYQDEMNIINKAFAEVMMAGDAKGRVFTFPIPTYNITADFDWSDKEFEVIWKMTGKYGIPYFSNFINSDMTPDDARSMCCRLRLDNRELLKRGGGLFGAAPLTGSIGIVTINLARIGYLAKTKEEFLEILKNKVLLAADSLSIKRKILESFTDKNLYPYSKFYLSNIKLKSGKYWGNHFSTIGIIGMNEACLNFFEKGIGTEEGQSLAIDVLDFLRSLITSIQEKTGDLFNLEATPAEGTSYRLAKIDKEKYPNSICANQEEYEFGASPFYTNSTQLPVNYSDNILTTLKLQDELQTKYTGGTVLHFFIGEQINDTTVVKSLIKKIATGFKLPYFTLTPTFSVCPVHGYIAGEQAKCPTCQGETEIYSRVVGYLRPIQQWNEGKRDEFDLRKLFKVES